MTKTLFIDKADPIGPRRPKSVLIDISYKLPKQMSLEQAEEYYDRQAQAIVDALFNSLPQGTRIRIVKKLFEKELSEFGFFRGI